MSSYQYRKSHCGDKTILRPSYLHNGISYTGKMSSLYWIGALVDQNMPVTQCICWWIFFYAFGIKGTNYMQSQWPIKFKNKHTAMPDPLNRNGDFASLLVFDREAWASPSYSREVTECHVCSWAGSWGPLGDYVTQRSRGPPFRPSSHGWGRRLSPPAASPHLDDLPWRRSAGAWTRSGKQSKIN